MWAGALEAVPTDEEDIVPSEASALFVLALRRLLLLPINVGEGNKENDG